MDELSRVQLDALWQALLIGTVRRPLVPPPALAALIANAPEGTDPVLIALALVGQHRRFEPPVVTGSRDVPAVAQHLHADPRPVLPDAPRRALRRVLDVIEKGVARVVVRAAMRRVADAGFKVHPFDLPWLAPFLAVGGETLGSAERAFLVLSRKPGTNDEPDDIDDEITDANWTAASRAQRRVFLRRRRAVDPGQGRTLLEGVFASRPAAERAYLLDALAVGLGPDDTPFLGSLATDRAESVRTSAAALLARMRGTPDHVARVAAAAGCFRRDGGVAGKLLRIVGVASAASLVFVAPDGADVREKTAAVRRLFQGLRLSDIAAAVGASARDILDALPDDELVFRDFHVTAVADRESDTLATLVEWRLTSGHEYPPAYVLERLVEAGPALLSGQAVASLLSSPGWLAAIARRTGMETQIAASDDGSLVFTASLLPVDAMPAFLAALAPLPVAKARPARAFADLALQLRP